MPRDSTPPIVPNGLQQMPTTAISELHAVSALINRVKGELGRDIADEIVGEDLREARAALHLAAIAMAEAEARIARQQRRISHLESLSMTDELTGLLNRRGFRGQVTKTLAQARRQDHGGVLMLIDLDRFKAVNDRFGHAAGDLVLTSVASVLQNFVRETDTVARLGGDEFAILMPAAVVGESQQRIATLDRLLNRHIVRYGNAKIAVRASIGCQAFTGRDTESDLLAGADEMMYAKKTATRKDRRG